jgi:hypothetical protein
MKTTNDLETDFRKWRTGLGLNLRQAGEKVGLKAVAAHYLDVGHYRPKLATRLLMDAVSRGIPLKPWRPE